MQQAIAHANERAKINILAKKKKMMLAAKVSDSWKLIVDWILRR
jgi:hypothetical protein